MNNAPRLVTHDWVTPDLEYMTLSKKRAILTPVKEPTNCKTRLSDLLSPVERGRLAWAMFMDLGRALSEVRTACTVFVVTSYDRAARYAREAGFEVLLENGQLSESSSVDWASGVLSSLGFDSVLRLPADIPLVQSEDLMLLLGAEAPSPGVLMVPSRDGTGTNAILRTPPQLFPSRFGPNSLALHIKEAEIAGAPYSIMPLERIALDIDEPADIQAFLQCASGSDNETFRLLREIKMPERLANTN